MTARQSHLRIMFCWQNLTLWYMMFAAERNALTNTLTAPKTPVLHEHESLGYVTGFHSPQMSTVISL